MNKVVATASGRRDAQISHAHGHALKPLDLHLKARAHSRATVRDEIDFW